MCVPAFVCACMVDYKREGREGVVKVLQEAKPQERGSDTRWRNESRVKKSLMKGEEKKSEEDDNLEGRGTVRCD